MDPKYSSGPYVVERSKQIDIFDGIVTLFGQMTSFLELKMMLLSSPVNFLGDRYHIWAK